MDMGTGPTAQRVPKKLNNNKITKQTTEMCTHIETKKHKYETLKKWENMIEVWTNVSKTWQQPDFQDKRLLTYAVMEMLAADMGLTSFTSLAFCRASFLLMASSCSSSSCNRQRKIFASHGRNYCHQQIKVEMFQGPFGLILSGPFSTKT